MSNKPEELESELDVFWECAMELSELFAKGEYDTKQFMHEKDAAFIEAKAQIISWAKSREEKELRRFAVWLNEDGIDVQTGKDNVDYYLEEGE